MSSTRKVEVANDRAQGNDDQAFWCLATMSALEYGFAEPDQAPASYLQVTENCFNNIVSRWDMASCGGGLKWQIYPENAYGYNYKNSISNGATFALAARLYRYTGNQTYATWASKIYDWTKGVGLIGDKFEVFDGTDEKTQCKSVSDKTEWTYNNAMFLHGCAFMYDASKDNTWKDRTNSFLDRAATFFNNPGNKQNVMYEVCENSSKGCNLDQQSFKAYLARWMAKTAILVPSTKDKIVTYLKTSAKAAAVACSGGSDGISCGSRWYTGNFDGLTGIGQQLAALEVTQALLMIKQNTLPSKGGESKPKPSASSTQVSSAAPSATATPSSTAAPSSTPASTSPSPSAAETKSTGAPASPSLSSAQSSAQNTTPSSSFAPSSTSEATNTGGLFGEVQPSSATGSCTCTPKSTVTVWVPPTPPTTSPIVTSSFTPVQPPPAANTTYSSTPPANSTSPVLFPGAASSVKLAGSTLFAAAALAVITALL